jgi:hypothetical protein
MPETIVCDQGKVFVLANLQAACASLGVSFQPAHPRTPTDKPHIERALGSGAGTRLPPRDHVIEMASTRGRFISQNADGG